MDYVFQKRGQRCSPGGRVWIRTSGQHVPTFVLEVSRLPKVENPDPKGFITDSVLVVDDSDKTGVVICGDPSIGSFCCEDKGINNNTFTCCETPAKVFVLGPVSRFQEGMSKAKVTADGIIFGKKSTTTLTLSVTVTPKASSTVSSSPPVRILVRPILTRNPRNLPFQLRLR